MGIAKGKGKIRIISISKIKNNTARRKNRSENGNRDRWGGSNPHSKAEFFSRFFVFEKFKDMVSKVIIIAIDKGRIIIVNIISDIMSIWIEYIVC